MLNRKLGGNRETFARKSSFEVSVKEEHRPLLLERVQALSKILRAIVVKTQLFVNFYFLDHQDTVDPFCFTQNFFYSVMQLVMGKEITSNNDKFPSDVRHSWNRYKIYLTETQGLAVLETISQRTRISDVLTEACVTLATAYHNHIVENFSGRLCTFFRYKLLAAFPVITK